MAARERRPEPAKTRRPPAKTPEAREQEMIAKAVDLAERQLEQGTASAQVISHYLKLGTTREKLEQEKLARENELLNAKVGAMESAKRIEDLYERALKSMKTYQGGDPSDESDPDL